MARERDWDTEWCQVSCEVCSCDVRDGARAHMVAYGHPPVVGGVPVTVGSGLRAVWKFAWKAEPPYDFEKDPEVDL